MSFNRVIWPRQDLPCNSWSEEDIQTLTVIGVPDVHPALTVEFATFQSPAGYLIIGEDSYAPEPGYVFLCGAEREVWYGHPLEGPRQFVNSSATALRMFLEGLWLGTSILDITEIDPVIKTRENSIWKPVLEYLDYGP
jgi:hypothetical protein